jgi:hypothetical protein
MATCPKGHESETLDYCDECGTLMGSSPAVVAAPAPAPVTSAVLCPYCGTPKSGRFCEEDGYDFVLAPPVPVVSAPPVVSAAPEYTIPPVAVAPPGVQSAAPVPSTPSVAPVGGSWQAVVRANRAYFDVVRAMGGEDADGLAFPPFAPERRFTLTGEQVVIGRRSKSRGVNPDIDLTGPPADPGVSHLHALLVAQADGWAVVDLDSANGTYVNDPSSTQIASNVPVTLAEGDRVYVGAWTELTLKRDS